MKNIFAPALTALALAGGAHADDGDAFITGVALEGNSVSIITAGTDLISERLTLPYVIASGEPASIFEDPVQILNAYITEYGSIPLNVEQYPNLDTSWGDVLEYNIDVSIAVPDSLELAAFMRAAAPPSETPTYTTAWRILNRFTEYSSNHEPVNWAATNVAQGYCDERALEASQNVQVVIMQQPTDVDSLVLTEVGGLSREWVVSGNIIPSFSHAYAPETVFSVREAHLNGQNIDATRAFSEAGDLVDAAYISLEPPIEPEQPYCRNQGWASYSIEYSTLDIRQTP